MLDIKMHDLSSSSIDPTRVQITDNTHLVLTGMVTTRAGSCTVINVELAIE